MELKSLDRRKYASELQAAASSLRANAHHTTQTWVNSGIMPQVVEQVYNWLKEAAEKDAEAARILKELDPTSS